VHNKDQATLIHAFSLIKPYCPKAKLILIGNGELEASLKVQVNANGLSKDIIFTGYLVNGFKYMKAFDCFVLSSIQEAFGRVLLEAMIAKRPIIATRAHGIPEVVGDAGTLIEPRDAMGLSAAMKNMYALTESQRDRLGETAYQHAVDHFSIPCFQRIFWDLPLIKSLKE
jgi:glycosyltransferase involved in cell wall biosynthesis